MRQITLIAVLLGTAAGVFADCKCPAFTPKDLTEAATYLFNGEVWDVAIERETQQRVITFDVTDTFKGTPPTRIEMRDAEEGKDCAIDFHEGESYLVYVRWQWGVTQTSRCWGTKRLQDAAPDAAVLGPSDAAKANYYDKLRILCLGKRDTSCCLSSLKEMRKGGYLPQPDGDCPEETLPNRLRCGGSYVWCVPMTAERGTR